MGKIYESPDKGKTIYEREMGDYTERLKPKYPELEGTNALCDDIIEKRTGKMTEEEWQAAERAQTSKTKMTSIEWLATYIKGITSLNCDDIIERAIEMHKQEIIDAWHNGYNNQSPMIDEENCGQTYYNETFKKD